MKTEAEIRYAAQEVVDAAAEAGFNIMVAIQFDQDDAFVIRGTHATCLGLVEKVKLVLHNEINTGLTPRC